MCKNPACEICHGKYPVSEEAKAVRDFNESITSVLTMINDKAMRKPMEPEEERRIKRDFERAPSFVSREA